MDYDVKKSLKRIEDELIDSMMRNLSNHLNEEEARDFDWSQWQVEQLKALEQLRRSNPKKYGRRFASINARMRKAIQEAEAKGQKEEELRILKALTEHKSLGERLSAGGNGVGGEQFFRTNESKLDALLSATQRDMEKAEQAVLRRANDQYRKIIFDAQVYANTGAGTVEKAVDMATKDFLAKGIDSIVYANGARHTISDYADMYIRTAERRAYLMGQGQKRQEWGLSLVIVNRRGTMKDGNRGHACPHCIPWLGKVLVDDVYSGGKPDRVHPLLSEAMAAGFLHPRCKDGFTTYFPGISSAPDPATRQEVAQAVEAEREENRENYAKRQMERFERLEKYSLDPENRQKYAVRAGEWKGNLRELTLNEDREEKLEPVSEKRVENSVDSGIISLSGEKEGALVKGYSTLGKIDTSLLEGTFGHIPTDELIITNERLGHIQERHPEDYELFLKYGSKAAQKPDSVIQDCSNIGTVFLIKKLPDTNLNVVVRLSLGDDKKHPKHSVMTFFRIREKNLRKLEKKNVVLYKRPESEYNIDT